MMTRDSPLNDNFIARQRVSQAAHFDATISGHIGFGGSRYRLAPEDLLLNLAPSIRTEAKGYFGPPRNIAWHRHASHGLSSQSCCLNFLMPLATRPDLLARLVGHTLGIDPPEMLGVEDGPSGEAWFVGFEWIGAEDHLNEAGKTGGRTRGANATSADAVVRFRHAGRTEILLIEWKYTERYGAPISPSGNQTRIKRYEALTFAPNGPIRNDLGLKLEDFFWEPFYQLLRQQMLAWQTQMKREHGADRARVLHISPSGNQALHKVTSPALRQFGNDAFTAFSAVLAQPDDFLSRSTAEVFGWLITEMVGDPWAQYLATRYGDLLLSGAP